MSKRKKFAKVAQALAEGLNQTEAVRRAGYSEQTARKKAFAIVRRQEVQSALTEAYERLGLTLDKLVQPVIAALDATEIVVDPNRGLVLTDQPAHEIRMKAYDRVTKAFGFIPMRTEMPPPPPPGLTVIIQKAEPVETKTKDITPPNATMPLNVRITRRDDSDE